MGLPPYNISGFPLGLVGFVTLSGGNSTWVGLVGEDTCTWLDEACRSGTAAPKRRTPHESYGFKNKTYRF